MANDTLKNIRLGVFVLVGTAFLIGSLYIIGNKQNLFGNTFRISAQFKNVNGLMVGNNVRYSGIDVGTVEAIEIVNDSSVNVVMVLEDNIRKYIKKNALAAIGTDGLMGNKLVNINSVRQVAPGVEEGDILLSVQPIEQDEMIRTLNSTNENMKAITGNLRTITERINSKNTLWSLLMDTNIASNVKASIVNIKIASNQSAILTGNIRNITENLKNGKGTLGALIVDTTIAGKLKQVVVRFEKVSDTMAIITGNVSQVVNGIQNGKGSVGILLKDTMFVHDLNESMNNINKGSVLLNEDLEALKHSWLFRKYFRKQEKLKNKKK
jgi:phospholipid/cholesterol/gamma-HCH transport system substrate-binding protein